MIVTIHQPHYLPWLGYLDRMQKADLFVVMDHVQFERRGYQNRTRILVDGQPQWLTVPVRQGSRADRIIDKLIDNPPADLSMSELRWWGPKQYQTLRHAYREAPFFDTYAPELKRILETRWERLVDLDQALLDFLRDAMGIRTPLVRSSGLAVEGARSELMLNLCRATGADALLVGMGGSRAYLDRDAFAEAGIELVYQEFKHPDYAQCGTGTPVHGLSAIDFLFNCGWRGASRASRDEIESIAA